MNFSEKDISFLILAGGKGSRMGYMDKSLLQYDDKQNFLEKILSEIEGEIDIFISKNTPFHSNDSRVKVIEDYFLDCGPLGGIHSGFLHSSSEYLFILTCDVPNISREFIRYIFNQISSDYDGIILRDNLGQIHPLCGIYRRTLFTNIENNLRDKNFKILNIFQNRNLKVLDAVEEEFNLEEILYNVNTSSQLEKIRKDLRNRGEGR
ncbi:MAG: molybdenum cofactor guanylyltransferase [Fusobacteriaceae bacterium]